MGAADPGEHQISTGRIELKPVLFVVPCTAGVHLMHKYRLNNSVIIGQGVLRARILRAAVASGVA
jgi:hypothetical protein